MLKNLPTTVWLLGAAVTITCFSPVVGQVVTAAPTAAVQPSAPATAPTPPTAEQLTPTPTPSAEPSAGASGTPAPGMPTATDDPSAEVAGALVKAGTTKLGQTAVDAAGKTLYLSVLDDRDPPRSVCRSAACLAAWKPLYLSKDQEKPVAGDGVDPALLGAVSRPDGSRQATLNGWPLYTFAQDQLPGDVLGEGLKGTWRAISPNGKNAVSAG
ncbi:COG4315 family predicted lipoprotein [Kribbella sp. CA-294648]|uniref:COG4315 family predicted lipoprotein n=1 Tax=Kribbella sp. CA-294648 TaxID=3239948 RepID=UPI003D9112CE